jgi:hypothetical protein
MSTQPQQPKKPTGSLSETTWFPHDNDAANDLKLAALLDDYGAAGYGIFWLITELLHAEPDGSLPLKAYVFKGIAKTSKSDAKTVEKLVRACLEEYDLFYEIEGKFTSGRVQRNKKRKQEVHEFKKEIGSKGGKAAQEKRRQGQSSGKAKLDQSSTSAKAQLDQNKAEERRGEEIYIDISSHIQVLQDSTGGTPSVESLERAFSASYPRRLSDQEREKVKRIFESFELEKAKAVIEAFILDLQSSGTKAEFFNDVIQYLET